MIDKDFNRLGRVAALRLVASALAIGVVLAAAPVSAQEDDDEPVRDRGVIGNIMSGLGAKDGNEDIRYRERSPLVIPPKLNLPPPESRRPEAANWPKDPDVIERRAARKAARERNKERENDPAYLMDPRNNGPVAGAARARQATASAQPGLRDDTRNIAEGNGLLSPSQLQSKMDIFNMFGSKETQKQETFAGEPIRESLTMPPPGYQTPANAGAGYASTSGSEKRQERIEDTQGGILAPGKF